MINKIKKLVIASIFSILVITESSLAEMKLGNFGSVSATVGVESQKYSKGQVYNRNQPTASVSINYQSPVGLYLITSIDHDRSDVGVTHGATYNYEWCTTPGFKTSLNNFTLDLSFENCARESAFTTGYYQAKLNYNFNKEVKGFVNYYLDDTPNGNFADNQFGTRTSTKYGQDAYEIGFSYNLGPVIITPMYTVVKNLNTTSSLDFAKKLYDIDFNFLVADTRAEGWIGNPTHVQKTHAILSAKKTF